MLFRSVDVALGDEDLLLGDLDVGARLAGTLPAAADAPTLDELLAKVSTMALDLLPDNHPGVDPASVFLQITALREAERIIEQEWVIRLSARDAEMFIQALESPPHPNATLKAALQHYQDAKRDDEGTSFSWQPRPKGV